MKYHNSLEIQHLHVHQCTTQHYNCKLLKVLLLLGKFFLETFRKKEGKRAACWKRPFVQHCETSCTREHTKQHQATYPPGTQSDSPRGRRALSWSWWRGYGHPPWWPLHQEATNYPDPPASWDTWHTGHTGVLRPLKFCPSFDFVPGRWHRWCPWFKLKYERCQILRPLFKRSRYGMPIIKCHANKTEILIF